MRFFVSRSLTESTFYIPCTIILPVQQNICAFNSVSAFTYCTLHFRFSFVPDARDADLRGANDLARSLILAFKAILHKASEGSHVTTVE